MLDRVPSPAGLPTEVTDLADGRAAEAVRRAAKDAGGLWAVVTCAGVDVPGRLEDVDPGVWERVVAVDLLGTVASPPVAAEGGGRVVTVASTLGHRAVADATAYCAAKFGVVGFTRALSAELRGEVAVTLLTPGGMDTAFFDERDDRQGRRRSSGCATPPTWPAPWPSPSPSPRAARSGSWSSPRPRSRPGTEPTDDSARGHGRPAGPTREPIARFLGRGAG